MRERSSRNAMPWHLGLALLWAARLTCIFNYPLFGIVVSGPSANNFLNMSMQVTYLVVVTGIGLMALRAPRLAHAVPTKGATVALFCGVVCAECASALQGPYAIAAYVAGGLLVGAGDALFSVLWGRFFVNGKLVDAKTQMPVCLAIGVVLYFAGTLLPRPLACALLLAYPLVSGYALSRGLAPRLAPEPSFSEGAYRHAASKLWPSLICVMVCALVFGLIGQIALTAPVERGAEHIIPPMGIALAGFFSCLLAFGIRAKVTFDGVYRGVFAGASVGLFLLPFLDENYSVLFNLFVICAYYLMEIYYFYYAVEIVQRFRISTYAVYGLSHGLLCAMTLLGIFLSVSVFSDSQYGTVQLVLIAFVSAYLLGMGLLVMLRRRAVSSRDDRLAPDDRGAEKEESAADLFSRDRTFTNRETEIFALLVTGRTSTFIGNVIGLSTSTVKGHIQSIYRKCGVHNRQELIDQFEAWKESRRGA